MEQADLSILDADAVEIPEEFRERARPVRMEQLAKEIGGTLRAKNMVAVGSVTGVLDFDTTPLEELVLRRYAHKEGVADANMDRAPMLVLTGQGSTDRLHKESHQIMDVVSMFKPVTKWAQPILHPDNIPEIVRKAVRLARTEKPGACHIELPEDIVEEMVEHPFFFPPEAARRPAAEDKAIRRAVRAATPLAGLPVGAKISGKLPTTSWVGSSTTGVRGSSEGTSSKSDEPPGEQS